jgi:hypothetical protein
MTSNEPPAPAGKQTPAKRGDDSSRKLVLEFDDFAWEALRDEASEMSVSPEELASFAVVYYLADHDSGRTARQLPRAAGRRKADADRSARRRSAPAPPQIGQR